MVDSRTCMDIIDVREKLLLMRGADLENGERYVERGYRAVMEPGGLTCYSVAIGESDLFVCTEGDLSGEARASLASHRSELEGYLEKHPSFGTAFRPVPVTGEAPEIVRDMGLAADIFGVGPMAAVAGAVAQYVGSDLLRRSGNIIVENGGDVFLAGGGLRKIRIFAGGSSPVVDVAVEDRPEGIGLCTSSATVGPSVSLGAADAVTVLAATATLADTAATAIGNAVRKAEDIDSALEKASRYEEVWGVVIVLEGYVGAWGRIELA